MNRRLLVVLVFGLVVGLLQIGQSNHINALTSQEDPDNDKKVQLKQIPADNYGLHNLLLITKRIYSGSEPHGEEAFKKLAELGVKTIVSVDGARPNLELAKKYGLRYVHIPIGYDGVSPDAGKSLARLVHETKQPVYIHCHHGKHRGPAAAAVACIADGAADGKAALQILKKAGTSKNYPGLWRDVQAYTTPAPGTKLPKLVSVAKVSSLAAIMAQIDRKYDNVKLCEKAKWKMPTDHPDLVPAQEALMLEQAFTQAAKELSKGQGKRFKAWLAESAAIAKNLRSALLSGKTEIATLQIKSLKASCNQCHRKHRN